jgi:hypothetical protein
MTSNDAPAAPKRYIEAILMPTDRIGVGTPLSVATEGGLAPEALRRPVLVAPGETHIETWQRVGGALSDPCEYQFVSVAPLDPPSPPAPSPGSMPYTEIAFDAALYPEHGDAAFSWVQAMTTQGYAPDTLNVLTTERDAVRIYERVGTPGATPVTYRSTGIALFLTGDETDPDIHVPIQNG